MGSLRDELFEFIKKRAVGETELLCGVSGEERSVIQRELKNMEKAGMIYLAKNDKYIAFPYDKKYRTVKVKIEDGEITIKKHPNIVLTIEDQEKLMDGDVVVLRLTNKGKHNIQYATLDKIVERQKSTEQFSVVEKDGKTMLYNPRFGYLKPNTNARLYENDIVLERVVFDEDSKIIDFEYVDRIGSKYDKNFEIRSLIVEKGCRLDFPEDVLEEAEELDTTISFEGRKDLTHLLTNTIDCDDTKDMDDAISVEKLFDGRFRLYVHIADVTHYVPYGSKLCCEAQERTTSIYAPGYVNPMFPQKVSNDICSLNPNELKYAITVEMLVDKRGKVIDGDVYKSVIRSSKKMAYSKVNEALDGTPEEDYKKFMKYLIDLDELSSLFENDKRIRGALDFNIKEVSIKLDDDDEVMSIDNKTRGKAERIVENCMLAANQQIARYLFDHERHLIYRIHEQPDVARVNDFIERFEAIGIRLPHKVDVTTPKGFRMLLNTIKSQENGDVLSETLLQALKRASYSVDCLGHFGLAMSEYCHFTSPIRRLPDLMVHYQLKSLLEDQEKIDLDTLKLLAYTSSVKERVADEIEMEASKIQMVKFMENYVGQTLKAVISRIDHKGMEIVLENGIKGDIGFSGMLDDFYKFYSEDFTIVSKKHHVKYHVGKTIPVRVVSTNMYDRRIEFAIGPTITKSKMLTFSKGERQII